ncbi:MAG: dynamin family protein [Kiritimatiellia bacterium]
MKDALQKFEEKLDRAYLRFAPLAQRYYYTFSRPSVTAGGIPVVLFLGNHSSGKSSLINWVLGDADVQDTGVAPTDDAFTVLLHGESAEDVCGPAALSRLPKEFKSLEVLGPSFLRHLTVKYRPFELLKKVALVDSPGMIDSAKGGVSRDYDFACAVRRFTLLADTVFFLFDPDKPGTTGETVDVFATALRGCEFKLRVLLNKCDCLKSLYDFARTYGAVCWNLARVLKTKDLPKIYTTYSGREKTPEDPSLNFADFNRHRAELLSVLEHAQVRRRDNVVAAAYADFMGLSLRMAVVDEAASRRARSQFVYTVAGFLLALVLGGSVFFALRGSSQGQGSWLPAVGAALSGCLVLAIAFSVGKLADFFLRKKLAGAVDQLYAEVFRKEIAVGKHDNLFQTWESLKAETGEVILKAPFRRPFFAEARRRKVESAAQELLAASCAFGAEKE